MSEPTEHPARVAAQASMVAAGARDRSAWLALFADDAVVEDPIGPSMLDPDGAGHRGAHAIADFYDTVIGPNRLGFDIRESYACGDEVANVGTITTTLPDGSRAIVDGVYTYRVDDLGRILALRAFWEVDAISFEAAPA